MSLKLEIEVNEDTPPEVVDYLGKVGSGYIGNSTQEHLASMSEDEARDFLAGYIKKKAEYFHAFEELLKAYEDKPLGLVSFMSHVYGLLDKVVSPDGFDISCKKGCTYCCYTNVDINEFEGAALYYVARQLNLKLKPKKLRAAVRHDKRVNPTNKYPCPFLDTQRKVCRAYEYRPIMCRKFFVVGDPKDCDVSESKQTMVVYNSLAELFNEVFCEFAAYCEAKDGGMEKILLKIMGD